MFKDKVILVTGGSGSWGNELTKQLLEKEPKKVIIFSRGELAQVNMERKFNDDRLKFIIGDVRDYSAVDRACKGVDYIFHLSALKHVPVCENHPHEAIKTNIDGTTNLINASINNNVKKFIDVSTDKACLDYFQTVSLSNGKKMKISEIVKHRKELYVDSWDGEKIVPNKIIGWYKNKLMGRDLYRLKYINAPIYGKKQSSIIVTEDHPILTNEGWIPAMELNNGDLVYTNEVVLNKKQKSLVLGTLLGDSSIVKKNKNYNRASLKVSHAEKQHEWITLKHDKLFPISNNIREYIDKRKNRQKSLVFNTNTNLYLSELYDKSHIKNKKIIPRDLVLETLNDNDTLGIFLSSIFMDDGYQTDNLIRISTHNFTKDDVEWFSNELNKIGLTSYVYICKYKDKRYPELRFRKDGSKKLTEIISKYIPNSLRYKLPVKYINNDYDYSAWDLGNHSYLKSPVVIEKLKNKPKRDVYCIDVENAHNFISAGIVVHNCLPVNLYGMTKAVGEKLTIQANQLTNNTDFVCIRGGNVLGSNGSVVPYFIDQIKRFNKVTVTDYTMTRFFLTLPEAIELLFQAAEFSVGGETYVMNMPSFYIMDLAKVIVQHYGNSDTKIEIIGLREGEKIDELLISEHESKTTYEFNKNYYVVLPELKINRDYSHIDETKKVNFKSFSSADNIKDEEYLYKLLNKGGFLL